MNTKDILRFQAIAEELLQRHYGVAIDATPLRDLTVVAWHIDAQLSPYEAVNQCADVCGWFKKALVWSVPGSCPSNLVSLEDEMDVVRALPEQRVLH